jgi:hypothetical protein
MHLGARGQGVFNPLGIPVEHLFEIGLGVSDRNMVRAGTRQFSAAACRPILSRVLRASDKMTTHTDELEQAIGMQTGGRGSCRASFPHRERLGRSPALPKCRHSSELPRLITVCAHRATSLCQRLFGPPLPPKNLRPRPEVGIIGSWQWGD